MDDLISSLFGRPIGMSPKMLELMAGGTPAAKEMIDMIKGGMSLQEKQRIVQQMRVRSVVNSTK